MDVVKQWAFSACAAVIVGAIIHMMAPNGKFEKIMKLTVSTFFLCCLFSPFILRSPALSFDVNSFFGEQAGSYASELEGQTNEQLYRQFRITLKEYIEKSLAEIDVVPNITDIEVDEEETDTTKIVKSVEMTLDESYQGREKEIVGTIKDVTGLKDDAVRVIFD
ncbi:stage III sporulation protein AF [Candidatus Soleaferrea massiliensis]|uniref:stage III sporulation protein AF n=1 Tax=Candidatus Soleaferrea massiliensis TaxID=1470354 RepID=UPI00058E72F6|nr:stage III sporulation protein AF [Candidatus Soleaferrea massiliensis]